MDKLLERCKLPELNKVETEILSRPVRREEIGLLIGSCVLGSAGEFFPQRFVTGCGPTCDQSQTVPRQVLVPGV